jgi:hypothetical protein
MTTLSAWLFSCQNSFGNIRPQCGQLITLGLTCFISCQTRFWREKGGRVAAENHVSGVNTTFANVQPNPYLQSSILKEINNKKRKRKNVREISPSYRQ